MTINVKVCSVCYLSFWIDNHLCLPQSVDVPVQDVPEEITAVAASFFAAKDAQTLADFTSTLVAIVFESVPESASSRVNPPKAKVPPHCQTELITH